MRRIHKRFSVFAGFAVLLAALIANSIVTRRQLAVQDANQGWVEHTQQVLLELAAVELLLKDAETGQRGFLYTGELPYLDPYNAAVQQLDAHLNRLGELTADNPQQQANLPVLHLLAKEKFDELAQTIELFRAGKQEQARTLVLSGAGKRTMDNIRSLTQTMQQQENSLLEARLNAVNRSTRILVRTIYIATSLAVIGLVLLAYYILREMDQRERHSAEIREREEWFRVTLSSIGDAVIATDEGGAVTFLNAIAEELTGMRIAEARGKPIRQVFPIINELTRQPVENPVAKVLEHGRIVGLANHTALQRSDGKMIPIEDSAAPIYDDQRKLRGVVMVFRDVTQEKQRQEIMRKAEKLAAASRLAASMAHEINNPLEAVTNLVYIVKNSEGLSNEQKDHLGMAERELERVSHVTRQTLGFYRDPAEPVAVELPAVVEAVMKLYQHKLKSKNVTVNLEMQLCPPVQGLQGELKQLLANLLANALDAVNDGGKITISARPADQAHETGVEITIADDGPGIPDENRKHIFEPFFTTKKDIGTGLGLWVCKQIAERHGGSIEVSNGLYKDFRGAIFKIFLLGISETDPASGIEQENVREQ